MPSEVQRVEFEIAGHRCVADVMQVRRTSHWCEPGCEDFLYGIKEPACGRPGGRPRLGRLVGDPARVNSLDPVAIAHHRGRFGGPRM